MVEDRGNQKWEKVTQGGQRQEKRKGYLRIQTEEGLGMDKDRTKACVCVSASSAVHLESVWLQGDLCHTFRERQRERIDIDGWFHGLCCTLVCRSGQVFFLVLQKDGREGRDNALLPGKMGSR